jgi:hypothetical protein
MSDEVTRDGEKAVKGGECFSCKKTIDLKEIELKDGQKTLICSDCLDKFAKLLSKKSKRGMYNKLHDFFEAIPRQQEQLALNFSEIADIMGHALPKTALNDRTWWANTKSPQGSSWLSAGWKLENIYMNTKVVVFRRKAENSLKSIPKYIKAILDGGAHIISPSAHVLTGWIRFCRKIGWYFEGKVLYERGGLSLDSLNETERAEVNEDYTVCKREIMRFKNEKSV